MKTYPLPAITRGLDVLGPETSMPKGGVRRATNVQLLDDGSFQMRPGFGPLITLQSAHSFWRSPAQTRVLAAAADTLYDVDVAAATAAPLFVGLPFDQPVEYDDVGPDIYFTAGGALRKIAPDGTVRRPGVANLFGDLPTLTATLGGLTAGRYGVAYSLVNDLGEESGISSIAWIDLPTGGGVLLSSLQTAPDVASVVLYITTPGGSELYQHATRPYAATSSIVDQTIGKLAERQYLQCMPGGSIVRLFNGRLYVVDGRWIWISQPLDYGVCDVKSGWISFNRTVTMLEPVEGGVFVGLRERTIFLAGSGPENFRQSPASDRGAFTHSSTRVKADRLSQQLAPQRDKPHAVWLCDAGMAVGRPDGSIVYPQADRLSLSAADSRPLIVQHGGIRQALFCADSLSIGLDGAVDLTI